MTDPRAGQPAEASDLIDVDAVLAAYDDRHAGPRTTPASGSSSARPATAARASTRVQRGPHRWRSPRRSASTAPARASTGPLFLGKDTHALSEPAWPTRARGAGRQRRQVLVDAARRLHADARRCRHAILAAQPGRRPSDRPTASWSRPSHNPPRDGGFKYNPPHGGPADTDATGWIADRANELLDDGLDGVRRIAVRPGPGRAQPLRLPRRLRRRPAARARPGRHPRGRRPHRRRPAGRRQRRLLGRDRRTPRARPDRRQPDWSTPPGVHDARLGRQDPDGLLVAVRHGVADRAARTSSTSPPATTPTPTGTASSPPTPG